MSNTIRSSHNRILLDSCVYTIFSMSPDEQVVKSEPSAHTHPHKHTPASIHARTHQPNVVSVAVCAFINSMLCVTYANTSYKGIHNHTLQPYIVQLDVHVRIRRTVYICRPLAIIHWLSRSTTGALCDHDCGRSCCLRCVCYVCSCICC